MNKAELIEQISKRTNTQKNIADKILSAALDVIQDSLKNGEDVKLVGFGTFSKTKRKARTGRNPKTGENVQIPSTFSAKFKPGKDLKNFLK